MTTKQNQARDWAYDYIMNLEEDKKDLYNDGHDVPTIGVGYALVVKGRKGWTVAPKAEQDFAAIGAPLTADDIRTLERIAEAKNKGDGTRAGVLIERLGLSVNDVQMRTLYDRAFDRHYDLARTIVGETAFDQLDAKRQGVLTMGAYQSPGRLKDVADDIRLGISEKTPSLVVGALARMGQKLNDPDRYNGLGQLYVDPDLRRSVSVKPGDALSRIARRHGTTVKALMDTNPHITNRNVIRAGDVLVLPAGARKGGAFVHDAQSAYALLGQNFTLEDGTYIGPSHEFSPEDAVAGTTTGKIATGRADKRAILERLTSFYGDATKARTALDGTLPEQARMTDFTPAATDALDGLERLLGADTIKRSFAAAPKRAHPTAPKIAGLFADKPTVDRVMRTSAYTTCTDPDHGFAVETTRAFYKAAYADDAPQSPTRQTVSEEPGRNALLNTMTANDRHLERIDEANTIDPDAASAPDATRASLSPPPRARRETLGAQSTLGAQTTLGARDTLDGLPDIDPPRTVRTPRIDLLGENAISAATPPAQSAPGSQPTLGAQPGNDAAQTTRTKLGRDVDTLRAGGNDRNTGAPMTMGGVLRRNSALRNRARQKFGPGKGFMGGFDKQQQQQIRSWLDDGGAKDLTERSDSSRVICTELVRQGLMAASLQRLDIAFTLKRLSPTTVRGYHFWAVPYARLMRRSAVATRIMLPIATWRALEIAHRMGERDAPHIRGKAVRAALEPLCWIIGRMIEALPGDQDRFHPYMTGVR